MAALELAKGVSVAEACNLLTKVPTGCTKTAPCPQSSYLTTRPGALSNRFQIDTLLLSRFPSADVAGSSGRIVRRVT